MAADNTPPPSDGRSIEDEEERAARLLADIDDIAATNGDATQLQPAELDLSQLYELSLELIMTTDAREILPRILRMAMSTSQAQRGIVFRFDVETGATSLVVSQGCDARLVAEAETYSRTILDEARLRKGVLSQDTMNDPRFQDIRSISLNEIRSLLCVPIASGDRVLGALYLDNRGTVHRFSHRATQIIGILAGLSAVAMQNAETYETLTRQIRQLSAELGRYSQFDEIIGRSRPMLEMLASLDRISVTDFPVLLRGESGSGKELICRAIHRSSPRAAAPLVVQNCAAIPADLLESELFGHARGAFTGAHADREGLFRRAHGGTLFLDEIADLDVRLQAKLLRVLEDGRVRPIGSETEYRVDFRLISATSVDMKKAVDDGRMRRDLYYRLNVVTVPIPPLRQRVSDIPLLVNHFLDKYGAVSSVGRKTFTRSAVECLQQMPWPGNVRELEHVIQRAMVLVEGTVIDRPDIERLADADTPGETNLSPVIGRMSLVEIEAWAIQEALRITNGNKARAAQLLGMHRNALLRRLTKVKNRAESSGPVN